MKAATVSAAGAAGLVPQPLASRHLFFVAMERGSYLPIPHTDWYSTTANGLLRQLNGSTSSSCVEMALGLHLLTRHTPW